MSSKAFVLGVILLMNLCAFNSSAGKGLKELWVIDPEKLNAAEQTLALTLQGLVAKEESAIWFAGDGMNALILEELREEGTETHSTDSVWELLQVFRAHVDEGKVLQAAYQHKVDIKAIQGVPIEGVLPSRASFISISPQDKVMISALKHSEDGSGIIMKMWNTSEL